MQDQNYKIRFYGDASGKFSNAQLCFLENREISINVEGKDNRILSLTNFDLELGGHNEDRIKLIDATNGLSIVSEDPELISALSKCDEGKLAAQAKTAELQLRKIGTGKKTYWWKTLAIIGAIFAVLYFSADFIFTALITRIDPPTEARLGRFISMGIQKEPYGPDLERLNRIGHRLVSNLKTNPYTFEFIVAPDDAINAFAYPGGLIVVNRGLLHRATDDAEIAGVVGHEIGHVLHRDELRKIGHSMGIWTLAQLCLGLTSPEHVEQIAKTLSTASNLDTLSYNRSQEHEADLAAVQLAMDSDYRPDAMISFFERLQKDPASSDKSKISLLSDHPLNEERIATVRAESERLQALLKATQTRKKRKEH